MLILNDAFTPDSEDEDFVADWLNKLSICPDMPDDLVLDRG
jgi:hypothetical protein